MLLNIKPIKRMDSPRQMHCSHQFFRMNKNNSINVIDVLYFDYWERGIRHFASIDKLLRGRFSSLLVHTGSQRGEAFGNSELYGVKILDLSFFYNNLVLMLCSLKPKVVILLNNQTEDRIIKRACRRLGIKTVFLMHGQILNTDAISAIQLVDSAFKAKDRIARIPKFLNLLYSYYQASAIKNPMGIFDARILKYFLLHAISPGSSLYTQSNSLDSIADYAFVYASDDVDLLCMLYGYSAKQCKVVGNQEFDGLCASYSSEPIIPWQHRDYCVYIENGFSDPKYPVPGWSEDLVADEVHGLSSICKEYGLRLKLKLHPSSDYNALLRRLSLCDNIEILSNVDISKLILNARFVVGQCSTLLSMAMAANVPILIPSISPLRLNGSRYADNQFGKVFKSLEEFHFLLGLMRRDPECFSLATLSLENFLGPLDGKAALRISEFVVNILDGKC